MPRKPLSDRLVRALQLPAHGRAEVYDSLLPSFGVRITPAGRKSWIIATRIRGRATRITIGRFPAISLADARTIARGMLTELAAGRDPRRRAVPGVHAAPGELSVADAIADYVRLYVAARHRDGGRRASRMFARLVTPVIGGAPLRSLSRGEIVRLIDGVAAQSGPIQANRCLALARHMLSWHLNRGTIDAHPAAGLRGPGKERVRDRTLTDDELRRLWRDAWVPLGWPVGHACRALTLTACRRGEVAGMTWAEVDRDTWTLPAARCKSGRAHTVPLSSAMLSLLETCPRILGSPFVFGAHGTPLGGWSRIIARASELAGVRGWSCHDVRRSVATRLAALGTPSEVIEAVLGHAVVGVRRHYIHHDFLPQVRVALEAWAAHIEALVGPA